MPSLTASHSSLEFSQSSWRNIFINRQYQSFIIFLSDCNWSKYKAELDVPDFHDTLEAFQDYNSSVINKEGLDLATAGCDVSIKQTYIGSSWHNFTKMTCDCDSWIVAR